MPSFNTLRPLFYLVLVLMTMNTIYSFRLTEDEFEKQLKEDQTDDSIVKKDDDNPVNLRSVLWPKICFKMYKDHYEHRHKRDVHSSQNHPIHLSQRPTRKCYPFDMK